MPHTSVPFIFRLTASFLLMAMVHIYASAQSGCTDPAAMNYNAAAVQNNGSCTYPATTGSVTLKGVFSSSIAESSGLVYLNGDLLTHNDSGNAAELFVVDTADGHIKQTIHIDNCANTDWEDITSDNDFIYVGDFGNNIGMRTDLKVLRIKRSDITAAVSIHVNAEAISFSYADQTSFAANSSTNFDCEAMLSLGTNLYLFTKDRGDNQTRVYILSKIPGTYVLTVHTSFTAGGKITGAAYNPMTGEVVLIGYGSYNAYSFLWRLTDFTGDLFFSGNKHRIELQPMAYWQTEGIAFDTLHNTLFISCETALSVSASLYVLNVNSAVITAATLPMPASALSVYPNPAHTSVQIHFSETIRCIELIDMLGKVVFRDAGETTAYTLLLDRFTYTDGLYCMRVHGNSAALEMRILLLH